MIQRLNAEDYHDAPYGRGMHVVLLCLADDLAVAASGPVRRLAETMPTVTFHVCCVTSPEQAETVQAVRYPQYRFVRNGSERYCHVGLLDDDELAECFDKLED
jgi:hypothetical protein